MPSGDIARHRLEHRVAALLVDAAVLAQEVPRGHAGER